MSGFDLLAALLNASAPLPIDFEKAKPVLIKDTHHAILDAALASVSSTRLQGLTEDQAMEIAHAALAHTLGYLEEGLKIDSKVPVTDDFETKMQKVRDDNHALGRAHLKFHDDAVKKGERARCTDDHFVEKPELAPVK